MSMRIAVIGATGVLGRHVVPRLIERGHAVRAGVRLAALSSGQPPSGQPSGSRQSTTVQPSSLQSSSPHAAALEAAGAELCPADILAGPSLAPLVAGCEVVLHLATVIPTSGAAPDWAPNDRVRREGTRLLLEAAQRAGARRIVAQSIAMLHASAVGTGAVGTGTGAGDSWVTEDSPFPAVLPTHRSALDLETLVRAAPLDWCILRGALFYGPGTGRDEAWRQAARAGSLRLPGDGSGYLSLIHVADMARAVVAAVEALARRAVYLVADNEPVTARELFGFIARQAGASPPAAGGAIPLGSFRVSNAKARRELGWEPAYPTYRAGMA
jgi:nucleoside-diphosphate-sugar epimerase